MTEYEIQLPIPHPPGVVLKYFQSRQKIDRFNINGIDAQQWLVHMTTGMSWASWGEDITINIYQDPNGNTNLVMRSKPALATTLVDFGRNQDNVSRLARAISADFYAPQ